MRRAFTHMVLLASIVMFTEAAGLGGNLARADPTASDYNFNQQAIAVAWTYTTGSNGPYKVDLKIFVNNVPAGNYSIYNVPSNSTQIDYVAAQRPGAGSTYYSKCIITDASGISYTYSSPTYAVP